MTNREAFNKNKKSNYSIEHNGITYAFGMVSPPMALKKAHAYVRKWVMEEWKRTMKNNDVTISLLAEGRVVADVYGCHKNRCVQSITL